jgi:hypothetical protein
MTASRSCARRVAGALLIVAAVPMAAAAADAMSAPGQASHARSYRPQYLTQSARQYYRSQWGVDDLRVQRAASGELIRFSYRVVDPMRAAMLGAERNVPYLIDPRRGAVLQIPKLEQVGDLRQRGEPVAGMTYWMAFSNKNQPVKAGDRVGVSIGSFHADGMLVE